ncbi:hypothetical protein ABZS76_33055 [Streptomyces sp. NPDC005562]|uniref:hypothetical protein n=1 Tax=Streptomyces sp. NPDC005562 TaxID=3154890 RepID=UPI0033A11FD0
MSVSVQALVQIALDGTVYEPGEWITLPEEQRMRARELVSYGLAKQAPAAPVKARKARTTS